MEETENSGANVGESDVCCDAEIIVLKSSEKNGENKGKISQDSASDAKAERDKRLREELRALEYLRNCCLQNNPDSKTSLDAASDSHSTRSLSNNSSPELHPSDPSQESSPAHRAQSPGHEAATTSPGSSPQNRAPPKLKPARNQPGRADARSQTFGKSVDSTAIHKWFTQRPMPKLLTALKTSICESLLDPTIACRPCPDKNALTIDDFAMTKKVCHS
jgi:hypothetical protein